MAKTEEKKRCLTTYGSFPAREGDNANKEKHTFMPVEESPINGKKKVLEGLLK